MISAYALYRRSTTQQDLSIEGQREAVRAWASDHDYEIVREFADDASGLDTARRREFLTLLELCARPDMRSADVVLCYDVSRFSRLDPEEAAFHEYSLKRAGVRVIYTHDPGANDGGLAGHLVKSLKRVLAHEYSQKLSQLVRRGHRAHAALGHWPGGRPPYGYRRAIGGADGATTLLEPGRWKARGERVVLVVDPLEAAVVHEAFEAYVRGGLGVRAIAQRLNARGVPAPSALRRIGRAAWAKGTVWAILRNPIYTGTLIYGKARYRDVGKKYGKQRLPPTEHVILEAAVPVIIERELWEAAQGRHGNARSFGKGRPWHRPYLLSGLIECGHCGKRFQAKKMARGRVPAYYLCGGYVASGSAFCASPRIPITYLEEAVLDGIQKRLDAVLDTSELARRVEELLGNCRSIEDAAVPELEARLRDTRQQIRRLVAALAAGTDDLPTVRTTLAELERERERLEEDVSRAKVLAAAAENPDAGIVADLLESLGNVRELMASGSPEERRSVVRSFMQGVRIDATNGQAVLRWYRLPRELSVKLVAVGGIEPPTRGL
jgi:DNA invertase Pin-like site-specific DNA recombinase